MSKTGARAGVLRGTASLLLMLLAGCGGSIHIPANLRTPTTAAVVKNSTQLPNGHWQYQLANSQTIEIDYDHTTSLLGGPQVGRLLLAGTDPGGRQWVAGVSVGPPDLPDGCFFLPDMGRATDGWIETNDGFRLPIAAEFTDARGSGRNEFASDRGGFCLNQRGEVTRYEP